MPNVKITDLTQLTTPATGDRLPIVDVSDTTDSPDGTTKYVEVEDLVATPGAHAASHQNGGSDEISVAGLSGVLADPQVAGAVIETSGPTVLIMDDVADGEFLKRSGSTVTSGVPTGTGAETGANSDITSMDGLTGALENPTQVIFPEAAAPSTPGAGKVTLYAKSDGLLYSKDDAGVETQLGGASITLDVDDISDPVFAADAGANDTYTATLSPAPSAYKTGVHYRFKANTANTGACTINFNGLGAKTIKKVAGGITTDLADNDIRSGQWVDLVYDGTNMQMQSTLGNAAGVSYPLLAPDGSLAAPSYAFTNGADCGIYLVNGTPDHLKVSVGNKEHLDIYQGTSSKPVVLLNLNNDNRLGWGNGTLRSGFADGGKGSVKAISNESGTSGCVYSATADLVDVAGTRRPWHTAGQVFRHVLTGNRTIGPVAADGGSNSNSGVIITIILVQDATGGRTVSWDSSYKWAGGSAPTMTSAANAVDIYRFWCDGSNQAFEISRSIDVK